MLNCCFLVCLGVVKLDSRYEVSDFSVDDEQVVGGGEAEVESCEEINGGKVPLSKYTSAL
jgi:hypothetical protein